MSIINSVMNKSMFLAGRSLEGTGAGIQWVGKKVIKLGESVENVGCEWTASAIVAKAVCDNHGEAVFTSEYLKEMHAKISADQGKEKADFEIFKANSAAVMAERLINRRGISKEEAINIAKKALS